MTAVVVSGAGLDAATPKLRRRWPFRISPIRVLAPIVVFVAVLACWSLVSHVLLDPQSRFLLPAPEQVIAKGLLDPVARTAIVAALWSTVQVALVGLVVAIVLGVSFAVVMSQARWAEYSLYPYAVVLQTIPILAVVPLFGFWFGYEFSSRVIVCVMVSLFPVVTNTLFGLKSVAPAEHDLFTLHGASRWQRLVKLQLPTALPAMISGFKISGGMAIIGSIVADFFFRQGEPGIGRMIDVYRQQLATEELLTALLLSSLVGLILFWLFDFLARRVDRAQGLRRDA
ncbi:nitrate ABC transporter permease [Nocardia neocaledoniensis NBRC 108232]|uniref:NitT/TauT family transport system permease protein n=1 Tax=Nocardia neocaledoniensis TaxID=236511 RepID=A0A317P438_9NOCA|nr:ABC transporter permease [Nocardia neocaledoniensis]PWV81028.1 NitT/TauT family transport system permease protein [Nocardia neocaledoniensis]GEM32966.1 nitrate ABC transporter permease [Nocardia neocaledoniensis NBRC 108232]